MYWSVLAIAVVIAFNFFLGVFVALKNIRARTNRIFLLMVAFMNIWMLSNFFENEIALVGRDGSEFLLRIDFASAVLLCYAFYLFSRFFLSDKDRMRPLFVLATGIPVGVIAALSFSDLVIFDVAQKVNILAYQSGPLFPLYALVLLGCIAYGIGILVRKAIRFSGIERKQVLFVLFGISVALLNGVVINLVLQTLYPITLDVSRIGLYGFAVFAASTTYAIVKHRLLNLRAIAAEAFTTILIFISVIEVFLSENFVQIVLRSVIFVGVSLFGILLVRSVLDEVRRREQIELLAQNLRAANDQLAALNEMKSNFVSIASHQLRAPIGGVRGYLLLMREGDYGKLGAKIGKVIDQCTDQLDHLLHVVNMFLDVTKMEAGKLVLERKDTDLRELATNAAADNELGVRNKGLTLSLALPQRAVILSVDGPKLRDVMYNFIENAVKYTTKGTIEVSVAVVGTVAEFRVKDSGMGIAEEEVPKLFAKFIRAGGGFRVAHGSGLGLYIAKTITEAHGGEVFVESAGEGKGSTFGCRLPLRKAAKRRRG